MGTAEELAAQVAKLNTAQTEEKTSLPTADDINAEQNADLMAGEILMEAKRKLSKAETKEKSALPTPEDIAAEKKEGAACSVESEQMARAAASKKAAEEKSKGLGTVDTKGGF